MQFWTHDTYTFPLPEGHRFPLPKYRLLRERLVATGVCAAEDIRVAEPASWEDLALVHAPEYLERVRTGTLSVREERVLGLPWSPQLVERGRRSTAGTIGAARDALSKGIGMNLGGGTHHAFRDSGRGYCLFNDVVVAIRLLRPGRVLVVDCDVHQGDGTASLLGGDDSAFTLSLHGARNYPFKRVASDLDVELASGTEDGEYLLALSRALDVALRAARPSLAFYLAGADPWEGDRLGRLSLTKAGLLERDQLVLDRLQEAGAAVCVVLAGGYAPDVSDTVDINAATAAAVVARTGSLQV